MRTVPPRGGSRPLTVLAMAVVVAVAVLLSAVPAQAEPGEGGSEKLRKALTAAAKAHIDATAKLKNSKRRQEELTTELKTVEAELTGLTVQVGEVAAQSYRLGRLTPMATLLESASPDEFLNRAMNLDVMAQRDGRKVRELTEVREAAKNAKIAIDSEVREQEKQLDILAKNKKKAEVALAAVSSGGGSGFGGGSASAASAPRSSDGSWPSESCSVNDPTTSGCISPRTLHMLKQSQADGFKRYVSCYRSGGGGEHPKGKACDFAAASSGFKNVSATGGDKAYGDQLATYLKNNAGRLGVMYVIWYRQIWMPNTGWRAYSGGGSPAADHTNHVHVSMY
ncbi:coiled-coil domain-containing protein [Salinispora fenicalii]|uniref:coiled-coil domain-containing protein n=1 Tax=Salinispora fenicalii TaxID=1137263 RepID=UPI0004852CB1